MAKKPPHPPKPPFDDFDPERDLNDEIVPIEEDVVEEVVVEDDLFGNVVADDGEGSTQLGHADAAEVLPEVEVEVEADELIVEEDLFGEVVADKGEGTTQLGHAGDDVLPEVEIEEDALLEADDDAFANVVVEDGDETTKLGHAGDEVLPDVEVDADDALVEDKSLAFGDDDLVAVEDELSAHEAETMGNMAALDEDDPFAGVGDEELVGAGVGGSGDDVEEPYVEEEAPKPKTHWFTWTLIGLNIVAALVAPYMLLLDYHKRQQYTYAVFMHDLAMLGLPNVDEKDAITAARVTLPGYQILPEDMARTFRGRNGVAAVSDKFEGFDGRIIRRVPPDMLDEDTLKEHFGNSFIKTPSPIVTVEDEVKRVQDAIVPDIKKAAEESFKSLPSDAVKRAGIEKMLHPLAMDAYQSEKLAQAIKDATGADLEKLYIEAATRRMAFDFLLPLELYRPGESKTAFVEWFGDLEKLPLDTVLKRVEDRIKSTIDETYQPAIHLGDEFANLKRDTIEKRLTISFTLLSLAHVKKPNGELLYPFLLERIPLVMGQYDFALACEFFPRGLLEVNQKVLERIGIDREGWEVPDKGGGALVRGKAFIDYYEDELQRIRFIQNDIFKAKIRLADLQEVQKRDTALLEQRKEQRDDVLKRIAVARAKTAKEMTELRVYQDELFRYETGLANSEETLRAIHDEIRKNNNLGGGKQP